MDDLRFKFWQMKDIFLFSKTSGLGLGHKLLPVRWTPEFFVGVEQLGLEVGHASPFNAEVKNGWSYTSTPPCVSLWRGQRQVYLS
jgi:hypothetical protein